MSFSDRVKAHDLPLDKLVVIGSGVLDQLDIRPARDIDMTVSRDLFAKLKDSGQYELKSTATEEYLMAGELDIWLSFDSSGDEPNFQDLWQNSFESEGVHYMDLDRLLAWKRRSGRDKDIADIKLIETYRA